MTMPARFKVVRTDRELEMPRTDAELRRWGGTVVVLPGAAVSAPRQPHSTAPARAAARAAGAPPAR